MKKFLCALLMVLLLTACGGTQPTNSETVSQPEDVSVESSSQMEEELTLTLTDYNMPWAGNFELSPQRAQLFKQQIEKMSPHEIEEYLKDSSDLADMTVKVSDIQQIDNINISFNTTFTNSLGASCTVPMGARIVYYMDNTGEQIHWAGKTFFGDKRNCSGGQLVINRHNNVLYKDVLAYDSTTMEQVGNNIHLSVYNDNYVLDVVKGKDGYAFIYADDGMEGFGFVSDSGKLTSYPMDGFDAHTNILVKNYYPERSKHSMNLYPYMDGWLTWLDDGNYLLYRGKWDDMGSYLYSFKDKQAYFVSETLKTETKGSCSVQILVAQEYERIGDRENCVIAIRKENGSVNKIAVISGESGDIFDDLSGDVSVNTDRLPSSITYTNENMAQSLTVNIDKETAIVQHQIEKLKLYEEFAKSKDGNYSLWAGGGYGGGDISYGQIVLKNNHTGQMKYIDTIGGMYGGSEYAGFFSNGDIYTIALDEFKVFTTDINQQGPVFEMSKNFPLGSGLAEDMGFRHLLAARRDPNDHSWVVLYNESGPYCKEASDYYMEGSLGDNFYKSTYKVGILDPQGRLTKVYDTGEYVMTYSFRTVEMYMAADNVIRFSVLFKGVSPQLEGEINLKTGEYTCISGGYNERK